MKKQYGIIVFALLLLGVGTAASMTTASIPAASDIDAAYTVDAPTLDGIVDAVWDAATELKVAVDGSFVDGMSTTGQNVTIKFLYTDTDLYMLVQYPDPTFSWTRGGSWQWDAVAGFQKSNDVLPEEQSEDRFAVMWSMDTAGFGTDGCVTKCHVINSSGYQVSPTHDIDEIHEVCDNCHVPGVNDANSSEDGAYFDAQGIYADMWHTKAARSLPLTHIGSGASFLGFVDDKYIGYVTVDAMGFPTTNDPDGGRYGDSGSSSYSHNRIGSLTVIDGVSYDAKNAPVYMETDPLDYYDAMVITVSELKSGEAVNITGLTNATISGYWAKYTALSVPTGASPIAIPERVLEMPEGSRADVLEGATWANGVWSCELSRKLVTGHYDDVQFDDLSASYDFDIALMDNTGGEGHSFHIGAPLSMGFAEKSSMVGPEGPTGSTGPTGPTGPAGDPGSAAEPLIVWGSIGISGVAIVVAIVAIVRKP